MTMVRALYTISVLALVAAGIVFGHCALCWLENGQRSEREPLPSTASRFQDALATRDDRASEMTSPLMTHAEAFAAYLSPPSATKAVRPTHNPDTGSRPTRVLAISPPSLSPNFRLQGTVYCTSRPETSMALIVMGTGQMGEQRWVKEGSVVGHLIIQEIKPSVVICRRQDDDQIWEMSVEARPPRPSVVQRYIPELTSASSHSSLGVKRLDVNAGSDGPP